MKKIVLCLFCLNAVALMTSAQNVSCRSCDMRIGDVMIVEEIKTVCWCGAAAKCNARFNENGIIREGDQVFLGGNSSYIALCRRHWREGNLGPNFSELLESADGDSESIPE